MISVTTFLNYIIKSIPHISAISDIVVGWWGAVFAVTDHILWDINNEILTRMIMCCVKAISDGNLWKKGRHIIGEVTPYAIVEHDIQLR